MFYALHPFYEPDGHSLDITVGEPFFSNVINPAYNFIEEHANVYDYFISYDHQNDYFIFNNLNETQKAADYLRRFQIQFQANEVELLAIDDTGPYDYETEYGRYRIVRLNESRIDGAVNEPTARFYTSE